MLTWHSIRVLDQDPNSTYRKAMKGRDMPRCFRSSPRFGADTETLSWQNTSRILSLLDYRSKDKDETKMLWSRLIFLAQLSLEGTWIRNSYAKLLWWAQMPGVRVWPASVLVGSKWGHLLTYKVDLNFEDLWGASCEFCARQIHPFPWFAVDGLLELLT